MYKEYIKPEIVVASFQTESIMIMDSTGDEKPEIFESNETIFDEEGGNRSLWDD